MMGESRRKGFGSCGGSALRVDRLAGIEAEPIEDGPKVGQNPLARDAAPVEPVGMTTLVPAHFCDFLVQSDLELGRERKPELSIDPLEQGLRLPEEIVVVDD